jgi:hypothetical protein
MACLAAAFAALVVISPVRAAWIWVEGEKPVKSTMNRHVWYDSVQKDQLSGGDWISNFAEGPGKAGTAEYAVNAPAAGWYEFWVRANPIQAKLSYKLNAAQWAPIDLDKDQVGSINIAADKKPDLRFITWVKVGQVTLKQGANTIAFRMDSANSNHGAIDCFLFSTEPFQPQGILKPSQIAEAQKRMAEQNKGWFAFAPKPDPFEPTAGMDMRFLNEKTAGDGGFIAVKDGHFVHSQTGEPVRFWAVNGPPDHDRESLRRTARMLAKHGVNLVRVHGGYFDENGNIDPAKVQHAIDIVECMKAEGIYTHFSIYFPLWIKPKANTPWLKGYDGNKNPFAALYFNKDFQQQYRAWWKALLLTPSKTDGKKLIDEPAVMGTEIINEDSYLFWTFSAENIPDPQLRIIEKQFGDWLKIRYGSLDAALKAWDGLKVDRDNLAEGRIGFRPIWNMFSERKSRDKDTVAFLVQSQREFYKQTYDFLRQTGFKGVVTCSNWTTASAEVLGPLEKYSYTVGDFIDRHGYFECNHKGEFAEWSIRDGHTYSDRSALKFEGSEPGKPKEFVHPVMDIHYDNKPSMISEVTWSRPNRYRSEAPLYLASYAALQDSDCIVNFALDGGTWAVKPQFWMQQWTLMSPSMMGQFPAAALIYRQGLVGVGDEMVKLDLKVQDLLDLKGTPMPQDAAFDDLRAKDVPAGTVIKPGNVIDPLIHYVGRTDVTFSEKGAAPKLANLKPFIDRAKQTVTSSNGQLKLDYGKGVLTISAPAAQGVSGSLRAAGTAELKDLSISSNLDLGNIVAVSLDGQPLASSGKILLQVMSEEQNGGFKTEPVSQGVKRIVSMGQDPWMARQMQGTVKFKRADAAQLKVSELDANGYRVKDLGNAAQITLSPTALYYLISR